jgi:glycerate 2-kinase
VKIVIAPQAFKECASALCVAKAIATGVSKVLPKAVLKQVLIADGGDGTLDALKENLNIQKIHAKVDDAMGNPIQAVWGAIPPHPPKAVVEIAQICGLARIPFEKRNPLISTTRGVGQMLNKILDEGCREIFIGLGGSATNDAGTGLAAVLGVRFLNRHGKELPPGGASLASLKHIDISALDSRLKEVHIVAGCDVMNPLLGDSGASLVYSPQKGASPKEAFQLEEAMQNFCAIVKKELGMDISTIPLGGSAGGMAAGLKAFLQAELVSGADWVLESIGFKGFLADADLLIIAEGRMDAQTAHYKAPLAAAKMAKKQGIPVIAIPGMLEEGTCLA